MGERSPGVKAPGEPKVGRHCGGGGERGRRNGPQSAISLMCDNEGIKLFYMFRHVPSHAQSSYVPWNEIEILCLF